MQVNKVIVHHIIKEHQSTGSTVVLSETLINASDNQVEELVSELDKSYRNKSIQYANFTTSGESFPRFLNGLRDDNTENFFIESTKGLVRNLDTRITGLAPASGGYLVFCDYEPIENQRKLAIFMIRMTESFLFNEDVVQDEDGEDVVSFSIADIEHLDLRKLAMACRVDYSTYLNNTDSKFLSLIKSGQPDISDYFYNWLSIDTEDIESDKEYTKNLLTIVEKIPPPIIDEESERRMSTADFVRSVAEYISLMESKSINLKALSRHYYNEEDHIEDFANQNEIPINTEFKLHPGAARDFKQYNFKSEGIVLQFPRRLLQENRVDTASENTIQIESRELFEMVANEKQKLDRNTQ